MGLNRDRLRNLTVSILVLLSFFLSYRLWTAGRDSGTEEMPTGQITRTDVSLVNHKQSDTFRPPFIALHGMNPLSPTLLGRSYALRSLMDQEYQKTNLERIIRIDQLSKEDYLSDLQTGRWLEFIYYEEMPLGLVQQKFEEISREDTNEFFNRILIDLDNLNYVNFYHTETEQLFVVSVIPGEDLEVAGYLNQENISYVDAFSTILGDNIVYLPNESVDISYRSFVVDRFAESVYISSFFPDTSLVDVRSTGSTTRYIDLTKEVAISDTTNRLSFVRQISDSGELEPANRYSRSFDQVNRFENWAETFILSEYDRESQTIVFRREISGFPVFSPQDNDTISSIQLVETGVTNLNLALRFISTPISIPVTDKIGTSKTLVSGRELIEQIQSINDEEIINSISNIVLGYTWQEKEEDNQVVDFIPEWYILVGENWLSFENFIKLHEEEITYGL